MAKIKNIKGILIDIDPLVPGTVSFYANKLGIKLRGNEPERMARLVATLFVKNDFVTPFSPFDQTLKKIYGKDFFDVSTVAILHDIEVYRHFGDIDGDIGINRMPCGYLSKDPVEIVSRWLGIKNKNIGKESNLATKFFRTSISSTSGINHE